MAGTGSLSCGGRRRAVLALALLLGLPAGAWASEDDAACAANASGSPAIHGGTGGSALVQRRTVVQRQTVHEHAEYLWKGGSDCARRLRHWSRRSAACLIIRDHKVLLVRVPYGRRPGWDFPGGRKKGREPACETAEREACEESGYAVRAVGRISRSVFRCEVVASNVCTKPVDEGFLAKRWVSRGEVGSVRFRGGTWGNKRHIILSNLPAASAPKPAPPLAAGPGGVDACGCKQGAEGWSTRAGRCSSSSQTSTSEAEECVRRGRKAGALDDCGCRRGEKGWSSTKGRCSSSSSTSPEEAAQCRSKQGALGAQGAPDDCGCWGGEGWSTRARRCSAGSQTSSAEAAACRYSRAS